MLLHSSNYNIESLLMQGSDSKRHPVLVVEDEPILRMAAVDMVEEAGFEAIEAPDAIEAISILETRPDIRIVFTDIDMPRGMDGLALAATIRNRWPPIEIIITSGYRNVLTNDLPSRCVFFSKPYRDVDIVQTIRSMSAAHH